MKKVLNYILLTAILGTFLPYSALAQTTDVGVNITGSVSIDVVTTISANITLDLTTGETTPTYMEIKNESEVPVNAKITNISTTSEGAPSTFVGVWDKNWGNLSKEETSTYVNFNILGEGQNVQPKDILSNTEIDLGTFSGNYGIGGDVPASGARIEHYNGINVFEINANFGRNWDEGDKNFTYQITTVYSVADEYVGVGSTFTYPTEISGITYMELVFYEENHPAIGSEIKSSGHQLVLNLYSNLQKSERDKIASQNYTVTVNGQALTKSVLSDYLIENGGYLQLGGDLEYGSSIGIPYILNELEGTSEGKTHYLKTVVTINGDSQYSYTFIEKVIVYSE